MPYFDFNIKNGRPIAIVEGGDNDNEIIYLHDETEEVCCKKCEKKGGCRNCNGGCCPNCNNEDEDEFNDDDALMYCCKDKFKILGKGGKIEIKLRNGKIQPIPFFKKEYRENIFISGPEGSGKSHWSANYIKKYKEMFPKNKVYVFSDVAKDEKIDKLKPIRMVLNEELVNDPITPEELKNSLVLFDDIDTINNKKVRESVKHLRDSLLEKGRHNLTYVLSLTHNPTNNKETKASLLESNAIVLFPRAGDEYHVKIVLQKYCGLSPQKVDEIMKMKSRWLVCYKRYPKYLLHEYGCFFP